MSIETHSRRRYGYQITTFVLLGCSAILLWKMYQLRSEAELRPVGANGVALRTLLDRPIRTSDGEWVKLSEVTSRYAVLFAFTAADCAACLPELTELNRAAQIREDLRVYGLMSYSSLEEMEQTRRNFGILYPLLQDAEGKLLQSLEVPRTPWKLVIDLLKRIVYQDLPTLTPVEREAFLLRLAGLPKS